jgi:extracellular elastinolytic metalloproteinase
VPIGTASPAPRPEPRPTERPFFDLREDAAAREAPGAPAQNSLRRSLGLHGVVDVNPLTGTPRVVARLDGFLTGPSDRDAVDVVLDYVRANPGVFKLDEDDLAGLRLVRDYADFRGVRHLVWAQTAGGIPLFDHDLRASVTADGRLVNVLGSPLPDLELPVGSPGFDGGRAVAAALRDVGRPVAAPPRTVAAARGAARTTRFAGGHRAGLVLFHDGRAVRLAWHVTADADGDEVYSSVVDAESGTVLRRANKVEDAQGRVHDYYPGAASGGTATLRAFPADWLSPGAQTLEGPFAHVYTDLDDDDVPDLGGDFGDENTPPNGVDSWNYSFTAYTSAQSLCAPTYSSTCSWDSYDNGPFPDPPGWYANRRQNSVQVFYYVNNFHDWLEQAPIGFDVASGNFEGADKVVAHSNDGANTGTASTFLGANMPDENHVNNANMLTLPDSFPPRMQMYLFTSFTGNYATDPTPDTNGGDDAAVVYHEYAHGLSNRLIAGSDGWGALDAFQSGAMGEGWSDWYAMDYLVEQGFAPDTVAAGEVTLDRYLGNGEPSLRTEGLDCPVAPVNADCPGGDDTGADGGYTLGDMGRIWSGGAEVHADGEIWAQTLWDLRDAVGGDTARGLVTDGMRLSPTNPSFLDMRNAILQADQAVNGGANEDAIWQVFAGRGMGYFADVQDANDTTPTESFATPPDPADGAGSLTGTVTDAVTGAPLGGVRVAFAPLDGLAATTDVLGQFEILDVPVGTYPRVVATRNAYGGAVVENVQIVADTEHVLDRQLRRNWASLGGGGRVHTWSGPDFTGDGCGPRHAIDQSLLSGWSSTTGAARQVTVKLPAYVDVNGIAIDPGAVCGDPDSASLRGYKVEVSPTGASGTWIVAKTGTFTLANAHRLNPFTLTKRRGIRYVRLTMTSNQGHPTFVDAAEFEVYGPASLLCLGVGATKVGTNGASTINGTAGRDVIVGLGGNDRIDGKGGNDVLCGGTGADVLIGGPGVDKFDGGNGNDTIYSRDTKKELTVRGGTGTDRARKDKADKTTSVERFF